MRTSNTFHSEKKFYFLIAIITMLTGTLSAQAIVTNGSFEDTAPGQFIGTDLTGWVIETASDLATQPEFSVVDDSVYDGAQALKIVVNSLGANDWDIQIVADSLPVTPGETYLYSIWAKSETAGAQVNLTVGNYDYSEYAAMRPVDLTEEWTQYIQEFSITDQETVIRAPIHFSRTGNEGHTIYLDNLTIINVNDIPDPAKPVVLEAEAGEVGSGFDLLDDGDIAYATIQTDLINSFNPGDTNRIITFEVTFSDSGEYDLYTRVRVGSENFDDDSFFAGNGFGEMDPSVDSNWVMVNGLASAGFSEPDEIVRDPGGLGSGVWKWINVSRNFNHAGTVFRYNVDPGDLTQTFQIAAREDGLDIDKVAFGKSYLTYTVENLDSVQAGSEGEPVDIWEGPPLASNQPKFVGNIYSTSQVPNFAAYWNQVTPENAGKWGSVEGTRDQMNWGGLDASYALAKDNGFPFHFHVLVWGAQQPSWISDLQPEEQLEEIREWFEAVAERYPDIDFLEVVNEPLLGHNPPDGINGRANYKEALGGNGETGWDWVITAFRMAREIFPADTKLMLNDYSIINNTNSTTQYLNIIRLLRAENLIDIIGEQGHAFTTTASTAIMKRNLDSLAATGLPIQITEMDIDGSTDEVQLQSYQRVFPLFYEHPGVEGITLWGWRRGLWRDEQGAYIINQNNSERPALQWLREYLDTVSIDPVSIEDVAFVPNEYHLYNNYPNPFNPSTQIMFSIPKTGYVSLKVYNMLGEEVVTLAEGIKQTGTYKVTFDAKGLGSGVYIYQLRSGKFMESKKLILMK